MNRSKILASFKATQQMDAIRRYSRDRLLKEESVLCHTGWACVWLVIAGQDYEDYCGEELDWGKLMRRAAVHDIDEIGTGDIPRVTKYATPEIRESMQAIELHSIKQTQREIETDILHLWLDSKDGSPEGELLALADLASVVYKAWDEIMTLGNSGFTQVAVECAHFVYEKIQELRKIEGVRLAIEVWQFEVLVDLHQLLSECAYHKENVI